MPQTLETQIKGVTIPQAVVETTLIALPQAGYSKTEFAAALSQAGLPEASDGDLVRRLMQFLKRQGVIDYNDANGLWSLTDLGRMRLPHQTLPLLNLPEAVALPISAPTLWDTISDLFQLSLRHLACLGIIAALISLNASFAWELGGEAPQFRVAFVFALMALDLMRPFLMAAGFSYFGRGKAFLASVAISVALLLSPVSILSSTAILSASFLLGAEMNSDADIRTETRSALQLEHARLLDRAAQEEASWQLECRRGGCGPVAEELEIRFQATIDEAKAILDRVVALADSEQGNSALLARLVTTFEGLGLFGASRQILLPLLLAISLEIAALFGPALLLGRK
ncbi:MAG: hypothetical protein KUG74_10805 [Rhodobacteraceae bacterium]|nr:hypothetical protein [Paracoccaceae bacterium]